MEFFSEHSVAAKATYKLAEAKYNISTIMYNTKKITSQIIENRLKIPNILARTKSHIPAKNYSKLQRR